ncbi:MAG: DUF1192 domain-containing protein [Alistipes sp.]|nr:DUF1192 domain-containing protein [Alistipes sp.]
MKRYLLPTIALLAAFAIGLAVNTYGRKLADRPPLADQDLQEVVRDLTERISILQDEIERLHTEIDSLNIATASLPANECAPDANPNNSEFFVDGLYFSRNGYILSKAKRIENQQTTTDYIYDEQGRVSAICTAPVNGTSSVATYEYSGKVVTYTHNILYDKDIHPNKEPVTITTVYEYY